MARRRWGSDAGITVLWCKLRGCTGLILNDNGRREAMKRLSNLRGQARLLLHGFCRVTVTCRASARARSIGGRLRAFLCSDGEGQSLVEFAVVLPILLMVLTFMFSISMAMISYEQLSSAVAGAAQQDLVNALV